MSVSKSIMATKEKVKRVRTHKNFVRFVITHEGLSTNTVTNLM